MNDKYKNDFLKAGQLAKQVRAFGKELIQKGASYNAILKQINQKIIDLQARAAFPPQIALNDTAAHFLVAPGEDIILSDQVVKLDIGVCYEGAIGDCAVTVDLSGRYQGLIHAAEEALLSAEKIIKVGLPIREIGRVIEEKITSLGYQPVRNLSGHGLGFYRIHMPPSIPNYDDQSKNIIKAGMTFAIEPFATTGKGSIYEEGEPMIFSFNSARSLPSLINREILGKIKAFNGLPFAMHDLIDKQHSLAEVRETLSQLLRLNAIYGYGPLIEEAHGMVAQAENSILVDKEGRVTITTR